MEPSLCLVWFSYIMSLLDIVQYTMHILPGSSIHNVLCCAYLFPPTNLESQEQKLPFVIT